MKGIGMTKFSGYSVAVAMLAAATLAGCPPPVTVDYHTQSIVAGANTLQGKTLFFMPDSSINFYSRTVVDGVTALPQPTDTATVVDFEANDPTVITLPEGSEVLYYGIAYDTLYIGSNGTVGFGAPGDNGSLTAHFGAASVSLLPVDATDNGDVSYEVFSNEVVVTFENVLVGTANNTFQAEFFVSGAEDGDLALSYPVVSVNVGGVVGLSNGQLAGANQAQIDAFLDDFSASELDQDNTGSAKLGA